MSPEGTGEAGATTEHADPRAVNGNAADARRADDADPWFSPGPKVEPRSEATVAAGDVTADSTLNGHTDDSGRWFLPTGRAGLMPDAMTVDWGDDETVTFESRIESAGAPPWAAEKTDRQARTPPPWETGPWPGPGLDGRRAPGSRRAPALSADGLGGVEGAYPPGGARRRWNARTVAAAGLVPLVVPGLVLGILSLRQPAGAAVRKAAWLAIGASLAWAVIIVLILSAASDGAAPCTGYPAAVRQAYQKVLTDLTDHAPLSAQAADLETAANRANASAAAAGQIGVRTALFAMAGDIAQARADVLARRPIPAALRQHIVQDGTVPAGSCAG
jgi:hypothetical protein